MNVRMGRWILALALCGAWPASEASAQWGWWGSLYWPSYSGWNTSYYAPSYSTYYAPSALGWTSNYAPSCGCATCDCNPCGTGCCNTVGYMPSCGSCGSGGSCGYGGCSTCGPGGCNSCGFGGCPGGICSAGNCANGSCGTGTCNTGSCAPDESDAWRRPAPDTRPSRAPADNSYESPAPSTNPSRDPLRDPVRDPAPMRTFEDPSYDRRTPGTSSSTPAAGDSQFRRSREETRPAPMEPNNAPSNNSEPDLFRSESRDAQRPALGDPETVRPRSTGPEAENGRQYGPATPGSENGSTNPRPMLSMDTKITWRAAPERTRVKVRAPLTTPVVARRVTAPAAADPNSEWQAVGGETRLVRK